MSLLDQIRIAQRDAGEAVVLKNLERMGLSPYATAEETASVTRTARPDENWLTAQVNRLDPHHNEQGNDAGYTRALERLAIELKMDRDHWKNNHGAQVQRARVLIERTDMPIERVQAYKHLENLTAERDAHQIGADSWRMKYEMCNAALKVFTKPEQVPVWLVATGEITNGMERYTRHDVCPPLCDAERLYTLPQARPMHTVEQATRHLLEVAQRAGLVVTIERRPLQPLAMGHAEYLVETRPMRGDA